MILVISGSNESLSRETLSKVLDKLPLAGLVRINYEAKLLIDCLQDASTVPMFGSHRSLLIEGMPEIAELKKLEHDFKSLPPEVKIIFWIPMDLKPNDPLTKFFTELSAQFYSSNKKEGDLIFNFLDALSSGNTSLTYSLFSKLRGKEVEPQYILGMIIWQHRQLIHAKLTTQYSLLAHPYVQRKLQLLLNNLSTEQIINRLEFLETCDEQIKNGTLSRSILIEHIMANFHANKNLSQAHN
ncbi:hypothetical protein A3A70_00560 [candidate division WWE3 bacterium RIFCSPLOWO2_01_FULL_42_11]|uniref:DNA-directed DNA polymerase n=1 Tax=candidate division WWE3 bacterium RIFCSPLOWO2_01_FULL_42_11 TaxID=1802627 RepID=A0A1F4VN62_UNCKA|nr:MAG: hypothetical protein A3A70_00560 [candidate division WWE3 bacterium RIFCSPLOWO2_01_FULL_42_11]